MDVLKMKTGLKYATRIWLYHILLLILGMMFLAGISNDVLRIGLNVLMLAAMLLMSFNEGAYNGEKACTLAASLEKQLKEGRTLDDKAKEQVFSRRIGAWLMIFGCLPFLLVSTVNAIVAPYYPEVVVQEEEEDTVGDFAFDYDAEEEEAAPVNKVNVFARLVFMPYVSIYTMVRGNVLNALFFLFSLPLPAAATVGYLLGPKMREKKLKDIARGKKRKMRNLKVNRKPRQPKAEV